MTSVHTGLYKTVSFPFRARRRGWGKCVVVVVVGRRGGGSTQRISQVVDRQDSPRERKTRASFCDAATEAHRVELRSLFFPPHRPAAVTAHNCCSHDQLQRSFAWERMLPSLTSIFIYFETLSAMPILGMPFSYARDAFFS